ncbi:alpha-ketoglutarate catabolism dioxygenase [Tremella mesenterica]|uniref:Alpha-ketoglutarate catabolism dioxygenase n=1 Tax=Tremella mesenterica TaxID=5217 RepID=A0A4Q1BW75_TREME|nr:alpha-ketoglutarate catabolism dioxygenase [Tremella mesenterica]
MSNASSDGGETLVDPYNYVGDVLGAGPGENYPFSDLLPYNPTRDKSDPPLPYFDITDRGHFADPACSRLNAAVKKAGGKIKDLGICVGSVVEGDIKLEDLTSEEKDDLALLVARRGVVFFRNQTGLDIDKQRELGKYFGPLHTHPVLAVPRRNGLDDVVVIYSDKDSRPDPYAFSRVELFHSDVTFEAQPPGTTILKLMTTPEVGNDTLWSSGYALYSSLSKPYQKYLESLSAVHSSFGQALWRSETLPTPRRQPLETIHPVVRVHPVTGFKSIFVNAGFVTRLVGVPKAESTNTLKFLFDSFAQQTDATCRWRWQDGDVALWDNRVVNHSATFDAYPSLRHGLRVTPQAERPLSVNSYEKQYGRQAKDWLEERYRVLGLDPPHMDQGGSISKSYKD